MHSYEPDGSKFKQVCMDLLNMAVLTKSATPGDIQVTHTHMSVGNNPLGKTVTACVLTESIEATTVVLIDIERAFTGDGEKIRLPTT